MVNQLAVASFRLPSCQVALRARSNTRNSTIFMDLLTILCMPRGYPLGRNLRAETSRSTNLSAVQDQFAARFSHTGPRRGRHASLLAGRRQMISSEARVVAGQFPCTMISNARTRLPCMVAAKQICAEFGGKMRYEVRQQNGKWLVWDTVLDDCAMKSALGAVNGLRSIIANTRYTPNGGLLVPTPNSVAFETTPAMFWTQEEAQQWADARNEIDQSGPV